MKANSVPIAAPLIGITKIHSEVLDKQVGELVVRAAMKAPGAPRPVLGGKGKGSKALWSREAVVAYFDKIAKSGKWPVAQREAA